MTRVLFIPEVETPKTSERTPMLFRTLQGMAEVVGLPSPWDRYIYDTGLQKIPRYLLYVVDKIALSLRGLLLARREGVERVVCATVHHAIPGLFIARLLGLPCIWDSQGNVRLFAESLGKGWLFTTVSTLLEGFLGRQVDALVTVSRRDAEAYAAMGVPAQKIHIIPICVELAKIDTLLADSPPGGDVNRLPVLLFFGSFKYGPNREAFDYINTVLAPALEEQGIRCEIRIAGRDIPGPPYHPFLRVLGFVAPIHPEIAAADLVPVPIWKGVGILTKVLDAMAAETPLIVSEFVANLIPGLEDGKHALTAAGPEDFKEKVKIALENPAVLRSLASHARRLVAERYDWAQYRDTIRDIVFGPIPAHREEA